MSKGQDKKISLLQLECGCAASCKQDGILIENPKCKQNPSRCKVNEYLKKHKTCLICGKCIICFSHENCGGLKNFFLKIYYRIILSFINLIIWWRYRHVN